MNWKRSTTVALIIIAIILFMGVSFIKFNTFNFVETSSSMLKIQFNKSEIEQVSHNPDIYISSPNSSMELLKEFMSERGLEYIPNDRMSSTLVFRDQPKDINVFVEFSVNRYYGMWEITKD
jgi:hypothetical protein